MSEMLELNEELFQERVLGTAGVALVEFYTERCPPCRILEGVLREMTAEVDDALLARVDSVEQEALCAMYQVQRVPTTIIFRDGTPVTRYVGVRPKRQLLRALDAAKEALASAPDAP